MTITAPHEVGTPSRWQRVRPPVVVAGVVLGASVALHFRDPHQSGSWGFCPWNLLTGTYCPGCGGLRAVNDLTRFEIGAAASSNLLFIVLLPLLVFLLGRWALERWTGRVRQPNTRRMQVFLVSLGVAAVVFTVLRNLTIGAWLAP
jgi:hypothetical protein